MQVELFLFTVSLLFFVSIFSDKIGNRLGVPALLLFLLVGMLFGPDGFGIRFESIKMAQGIGTVALCIILFSGGMDTKISDVVPVLGPGISLATVGVLLTATITGIITFYLFHKIGSTPNFSLPLAFLMASTMASTDSASVFSILSAQGTRLKNNLKPLLELESGSNDPMAYILTTTLIGIVTAHTDDISALAIVQDIVVQLLVGGMLGFLFGHAIIWLMRKLELTTESLYPIMVLTACIFIFSMTYFLKGNPYLAVYIGGLIIGNNKFMRKRQTKSFFNGLSWLSQLVMFLMLGLMVVPTDFLQMNVWLPCLLISFVMIFIARPCSVFLSLYPFKQYCAKDKLFVSWVGLRGAVPIIFSIMCRAAEVPYADLIFNVVFLSTLLSLLVQGTTITRMARALDLTLPPNKPHSPKHFDIDLPDEITSAATELEVTAEMLQNGTTLKDINLPDGTLVILVRRGEAYFVPKGTSELKKNDLLLIITDNGKTLSQQYAQQEEGRDSFTAINAGVKKMIILFKGKGNNDEDGTVDGGDGHDGDGGDEGNPSAS